MSINVLYLYYDLLNLYGESGNVNMLKKHFESHGVSVYIDTKTINDTIDFSIYDFVYMGSGSYKNLEIAINDLKKYKDNIISYINSNKFFLVTGNSMEIFGKSINKKKALEIFDYETITLKNRVVSDVIYKCQHLNIRVIGYINRTIEVYHNMSPLFEVECGVGENKLNDYEGFKYLNFWGTHLLGPLLSKNPILLERIVHDVIKQKDENFKYDEIEYPYERASYLITLNDIRKQSEE